jgi:CheY-like chemotaxis protein
VEDSGIGIRSADLSRLFDDFVRIEEKRTKNIVGTGLGLAISRSLCRAMGGDVSVESEYGKGSIFTAMLPQSIVDRRPVGTLECRAAARMEKQRIPFTAPDAEILLVDDLRSNLLVCEGLLAPFGARISTCLSGEEAVELLRSRSFDIVFMDHMMPGMDGMEATAAIRSMKECETMPIVALTANAVAGMRETFLQNGFSDFLSKPIEIPKLIQIMAKWIPVEKRGPAQDEAGQPAALEQMKLPAIEGIDILVGLARTGGEKKHYLDLLEVFCRDARTRLPLFEKVPGEKERGTFITQVHALKSASASIGAVELAAVAARLEEAGRNGDMSVINDNLGAFFVALKAIPANIEEALARVRQSEGRDGGRQRGVWS